jgi:hypothetical protein
MIVRRRSPYILDSRLTNGDEVVRFTRRPLFTPGRFLVLISVRSLEDFRVIVPLERLG